MLKIKAIYRTVSIFLCAAMFFVTGTAAYADEKQPPDVTDLIYSDDFESGALSDSYKVVSAKGTGSAEVVDDLKENTHGKVAYIHSPSESGGGAAITLDLKDKMIQGNTGKYLIEYDFLLHNKCGWAPYISLRASDVDKDGFWTSNTTTLNVVGINGSFYSSFANTLKPGQIWDMMNKSPENKVTTDDAKWHRASVVLDTTSNVAEYYYDGIYVGKQNSSVVNGEFSKGIKLLQFQIAGDDVSFNMYIDNIHIGKVNPYVSNLSVINYDGNAVSIENNAELNVVSNTISAEFNYTENPEEESDKIRLTRSGDDVAFTKKFDSATNKVIIKTDDYLADGAQYSLEILDEKYLFTVKQTKAVILSAGNVKRGGIIMDSTDALNAGDDLSAEFNILNTTGEPQKIKCYALCYDGNLMKSVSEANIEFTDTEISKTAEINFKAVEAQNAKIYLLALDAENNKFLDDAIIISKSVEIPEINDLIAVNGKLDLKDDASVGRALLTIFEPNSETVHWLNEVNISNDGTFDAVIGFDRESDKSGVYSGKIVCGEISQTVSSEYINAREHKAAVTELLNLKNNKADFIGKLKEGHNELGIIDANDSVCEIYYNYYTKNTVTADNVDDNIKTAKRCDALSKVNSGEDKNIFDDEFDFNTFDIYEFMKAKYFTETVKINITDALSKMKLKSLDDLNDALTECFVLKLTESPDGYENLYEPFKKFASKIGVGENDITNARCKKVAGKAFSSYSELKSALLKSEDTSSSGSSGSSGSGRGTGISGKEPVQNQNQTKTDAIPKNIFKDVDDDFWATDAIVYLTEKGIVNGKTKDTFEPDSYVTREEFVKMIIGALYDEQTAKEVVSNNPDFADVKSDEWYYPFIQKAFRAGIVTGFDNNEFGIDENITREDMAVIFQRAIEKFELIIQDKGISGRFDDEDMIADYALSSVESLKSTGIIKGDNNMFNPKANATRAEAAMMLYRIINS